MDKNHFNPVFIGHGSPMNAIADNDWSRFLERYAASIPKPEAILVISAHWQTEGTRITASARPEQIYDFYGFPDELYEVRYAPAGEPDIAMSITERIPEIHGDENRGIDHAGWAIVNRMYPAGDVPLLELSLDRRKSEREHYEFGKSLAPLCNDGILVIGSGNVVHNLRDIDFDEKAKVFPWAKAADDWIEGRLASGDFEKLIDYRQYMPEARRAVPTNEHYLPFLCILGMATGAKSIHTIHEETQNGSISMRSIEIDFGEGMS
jgi:4,5-DOPA dioxygenase extradiol